MFKKILKCLGFKCDANSQASKDIERLPPTHFFDMKEDMLEYTEQMAYKALDERKNTHDKIREDARKTLSLLLGGMGLFFGLSVHYLIREEVSNALAITLMAGSVWLCMCCFFLLKHCVQSIAMPPRYPAPETFYDQWVREKQPSLESVRKRFLTVVQADIENMIRINQRTVGNLDITRYTAASTPIILIALYFFLRQVGIGV